MGCNKKRISDIEARLAEIAKLKAAVEARLQSNKEVDSSKIKIANAKYYKKKKTGKIKVIDSNFKTQFKLLKLENKELKERIKELEEKLFGYDSDID